MRHLRLLAVAAALAVAFPVMAADSSTKYYAQDTELTVRGVPVRVLAGSSYQSLTVTDTSIQLTLGAGEATIFRTSGPTPFGLETGGVAAACNVLQDRDNQLILNGPGTFEVFPNQAACSTADYSTNQTPAVTLPAPAAGQSLTYGQVFQLLWSSSGRTPASMRLSLSTDGGETYPTEVAADIYNSGSYSWTVPDVTTGEARLRLEGFEGGQVVSISLSPVFSIVGTQPAVVEEEPAAPSAPAYDYSPADQLAAAVSVDDGVGFVAPEGGLPADNLCPAGLRVKIASSSAVYYCGRDGKRHAFPNSRVHDSWFSDFVGVLTVADTKLAAMPLGKNVLYRPGDRLLKLATDPKVYAVAEGGVLRWIETEAAARDLYGADWNTKIDDVPDTFFADYTVGESIK